jgi:hypothetical protein
MFGKIDRIAPMASEPKRGSLRRFVVLFVLVAAIGGVSIPAASADGVNLCIGCAPASSSSSGSTSICLDSAVCPHWGTWGAYRVLGPVSYSNQRIGANDYMVYVYWAFDSTLRFYYGNVACYWLGNTIFRGCFWM